MSRKSAARSRPDPDGMRSEAEWLDAGAALAERTQAFRDYAPVLRKRAADLRALAKRIDMAVAAFTAGFKVGMRQSRRELKAAARRRNP